MPPKPQIFKTPDGKEFTKKSEWRDYMVETFYSFKNKTNEPEPLVKAPGDVAGQMFTIENCDGCTMALCDQSEQVHVDNVKNSRVMIGACASSIFIRNCQDSVFYCCSQQLRLRDCVRCKFYVFSVAEVHIELSSKVEFGPFRGGYPEHGDHLKAAKLDTQHNLWYDIYDHNDSLKTKENWALIDPAKYESPWFPLGECEPALKVTAVGTVDRSNAADSSMESFSVEQLKIGSAESSSAPPVPTATVAESAVAPAAAIEVAPPAPAPDAPAATTETAPVLPVETAEDIPAAISVVGLPPPAPVPSASSAPTDPAAAAAPPAPPAATE